MLSDSQGAFRPKIAIPLLVALTCLAMAIVVWTNGSSSIVAAADDDHETVEIIVEDTDNQEGANNPKDNISLVQAEPVSQNKAAGQQVVRAFLQRSKTN